MAIMDRDKPIAGQFAGVEAVLDVGGSMGTREMYDAALDAKLWQILGTGLDHVDLEDRQVIAGRVREGERRLPRGSRR